VYARSASRCWLCDPKEAKMNKTTTLSFAFAASPEPVSLAVRCLSGTHTA